MKVPTCPLSSVVALLVIVVCRLGFGEPSFADWGWRVPFPISAALALPSIHIRFKIEESPIVAFLVELFPARIRHTSRPLPCRVGNGVVGGLVPAAGASIAAVIGVALSGLLYPMAIAAIGVVVSLTFIREPTRRVRIREKGSGAPPLVLDRRAGGSQPQTGRASPARRFFASRPVWPPAAQPFSARANVARRGVSVGAPSIGRERISSFSATVPAI